MKHKKKRWGGIMLLAAMLALMLSMGSVYAADEYVPVQGSADSVKIAKTLDLKGSTSGPEHTVTFTIEYVSSESSPAGQSITGSISPVTMTFSGDDDEKEAFIDFSAVKFSLPGTYRFKVTETGVPNSYGIKRKNGSEARYYVDVHVINTNDQAGHSGLKIQGYQIYKGSNTSEKSDSLLFQNEWDNYRIRVRKNVTGNRGDKTRPFNIYVNLENFGSSNKVYVRWVSGTPAVGQNPSSAAKVTAANPVTVTGSTSTWSPVNLLLKDGDEVILEGMSSSMNFYIWETPVDEYTTTGTFNATDKKSVVDENDKEFIVTNHKSGDMPTGIFINNWPYILSVLAVLAGCIVFVRRRKARYEYEEDL